MPLGVAVDASGNVYVADNGNHRIRIITPAGVVSTLAGCTRGFADGTDSSAQFTRPTGVAIDASGTVYVADYGNHRIRKITPAGEVSTLAGSTRGFADGTGSSAQFNRPTGVAIDASGTVYVADQSNHRIRKITAAGEVSTLAGSGVAGFADGTGSSAQFRDPFGVAVDASGNVYVGDRANLRIRKVTPAGVVSTLAGSGVSGFADGTGSSAQFRTPTGVAVDASGNVYVADANNHRIRKVTPAGVVSTLAGSGVSGFADGTGSSAQFRFPYGVAVDASGTVYVADASNHRIRLIEQNTSVAGTPTSSEVGDHQVVLEASDGSGGVVNQSFTITVNDITPPVITSVSVPTNATYTAGQNLDFTVNFNENVTVDTASGSPQLGITIGTDTRQAVYQSGSGTAALAFRYTVQVGDIDTDGIAVGTLAANGGTLRDAAGNDADLTLNNVGLTSEIFVDAPATLNVIGLAATNKPYDGSTVASVTGTAVLSSNVQPGDEVTLTGTPVYTFVNANVGTAIAISTTGFSLSGADAGKYTLTQPVFSADITARPITITAQTQSKVYGTALTLDNTAFTVTDLNGDSVLPNGELIDVVSMSSATGVAASTTADIGTYADELIISSQTGSNGFDATNYSLTYVAGDLVVTPATQTGLVFADNSFTYDGLVKSLVVTGQASDATVTYTNNNQIDAGTYTVTATVARPNYTTAVLNATLAINKAEAVITANAVQTFTFDGTVKNVNASLNH
ncbi:YDG domain-containing protein, partial [Psychroflexus aurantiacus]|uniref:YDG domain-containing protein n=1 Tax=Psychroflexus aurantiacus TaxID=2709310 RepID=UPI00374414EA